MFVYIYASGAGGLDVCHVTRGTNAPDVVKVEIDPATSS